MVRWRRGVPDPAAPPGQRRAHRIAFARAGQPLAHQPAGRPVGALPRAATLGLALGKGPESAHQEQRDRGHRDHQQDGAGVVPAQAVRDSVGDRRVQPKPTPATTVNRPSADRRRPRWRNVQRQWPTKDRSSAAPNAARFAITAELCEQLDQGPEQDDVDRGRGAADAGKAHVLEGEIAKVAPSAASKGSPMRPVPLWHRTRTAHPRQSRAERGPDSWGAASPR